MKGVEAIGVLFSCPGEPWEAQERRRRVGRISTRRGAKNLDTRPFSGARRAARPVPEVTAADKEDGLRGPWSQYSRDGPGRQAGELCNALEAEIRTSVQAQGHYLTGRFSPGYGDCPLTLQQPFAIALDTVRGLGMAVTPENLLTPRKSVTAILGVADHPVTGTRAGCGHCLLREKCEYRKRGTTCEN